MSSMLGQYYAKDTSVVSPGVLGFEPTAFWSQGQQPNHQAGVSKNKSDNHALSDNAK